MQASPTLLIIEDDPDNARSDEEAAQDAGDVLPLREVSTLRLTGGVVDDDAARVGEIDAQVDAVLPDAVDFGARMALQCGGDGRGEGAVVDLPGGLNGERRIARPLHQLRLDLDSGDVLADFVVKLARQLLAGVLFGMDQFFRQRPSGLR